MWSAVFLLIAALVFRAQGLYFYIDGAMSKCFFEELPKDTLVVGAKGPSHNHHSAFYLPGILSMAQISNSL